MEGEQHGVSNCTAAIINTGHVPPPCSAKGMTVHLYIHTMRSMGLTSTSSVIIGCRSSGEDGEFFAQVVSPDGEDFVAQPPHRCWFAAIPLPHAGVESPS